MPEDNVFEEFAELIEVIDEQSNQDTDYGVKFYGRED